MCYINTKKIWKFIKDLGIISILLSVLTFWIIEHNNYIKIKNEIKIENENNLKKTEFISQDSNDEWLYLHNFSNYIYKENWNYITQYYDNECVLIFRTMSLNMDSANTLINLRISGVINQDHQGKLKKINNNLIESLNYILQHCSGFSWKIIYKVY